MEKGVSIIICSYNGGQRLPETLKYLALLEVPNHIPWEILLVDNASTDGTADIARKEWEKHGISSADFRILSENRQGKNFAFKTGIFAAKFSYILTCDDDNWLTAGYLNRAFQLMEADDSIGALGGCGIFEPEQPLNVKISAYSSYFVNGPQTWTDGEHWVYGAGSVYRKSILVDLFERGWRQITSGRSGSSLICGEDVEICFMIFLSGYRIVSDEQLLFRHFVPLGRQKLSYIANLVFWLNYTHVLLNSYYPILNKDNRPIQSILDNWYLSSIKILVKRTLRLVFKRSQFWKDSSFEAQLAYKAAHGTWYGLYKNRQAIIQHHQQTLRLLENHQVYQER